MHDTTPTSRDTARSAILRLIAARIVAELQGEQQQGLEPTPMPAENPHHESRHLQPIQFR
jgi:hypothetical protein